MDFSARDADNYRHFDQPSAIEFLFFFIRHPYSSLINFRLHGAMKKHREGKRRKYAARFSGGCRR